MSKILLADDHALFRAGVRKLLASSKEIEIVAEAADAPSTMRALANHCVDLVVLDLTMPGTKGSSPELLIDAVRNVLAGGRFISPALATRMALETPGPSKAHQMLSAREREVFEMIVDGIALIEIAERLKLSPKTITTHKTHLMEKLGVETNADLIRYAIEHKVFG